MGVRNECHEGGIQVIKVGHQHKRMAVFREVNKNGMRWIGGHDLSEFVQIKVDRPDLIIGGGNEILGKGIDSVESVTCY